MYSKIYLQSVQFKFNYIKKRMIDRNQKLRFIIFLLPKKSLRDIKFEIIYKIYQ